METVEHRKYVTLLENLMDELEGRFADFRRHSAGLKLIAVPESLQMKLIDFHSNSDLKTALVHNDLLTFYGRYVSAETFLNIVERALETLCLFIITYSCEQKFS